MIYLLKIILAFCSIVYELVLAQALSAFLANTVLRYSVTIGLYMFSMGFGAMIAEGRWVRRPLESLIKLELGLTLIGGYAIVLLYFLDFLSLPGILFSAIAHLLIIMIGILTGCEIPLVMKMVGNEKNHGENFILAFDYFGALLGTVFFAFVFYPRWGLVSTAFVAGCLNACVAVYLITSQQKEGHPEGWSRCAIGVSWSLLIVLFMSLVFSSIIETFFSSLYLM